MPTFVFLKHGEQVSEWVVERPSLMPLHALTRTTRTPLGGVRAGRFGEVATTGIGQLFGLGVSSIRDPATSTAPAQPPPHPPPPLPTHHPPTSHRPRPPPSPGRGREGRTLQSALRRFVSKLPMAAAAARVRLVVHSRKGGSIQCTRQLLPQSAFDINHNVCARVRVKIDSIASIRHKTFLGSLFSPRLFLGDLAGSRERTQLFLR